MIGAALDERRHLLVRVLSPSDDQAAGFVERFFDTVGADGATEARVLWLEAPGPKPPDSGAARSISR